MCNRKSDPKSWSNKPESIRSTHEKDMLASKKHE